MHYIIFGDVSLSVCNQRVIEVDMGALITGAKFFSEFEERLNAVLSEKNNYDPPVVLFIEENLTMGGTGKKDREMGAGNLLKPMLARGELRCIGAKTSDEHR